MDSVEDDMRLLLSALSFSKDDVEQQTQTLKTLATLCSNDGGSEHLHKLGGLRTITELFCHSSSPKIKQWSLFVLSNAIRDNVANKKILCIPEMMKRIASLLSSKKPNILTVSAANFILSLCANYGPAQEQTRTSGCLQKLLSLYRLSSPKPDVWFEAPNDLSLNLWITVSSALGSTMSNPHNDKNQLRCADMLPQAISMLKNANKQLLTTALNFIGHVISENGNSQRMFGLVGGLHVLVSLLKRATEDRSFGNESLLTHILSTIGWGLTHHEENKKTVGSLGLVSLVVGLLDDSRTTEDVAYSSLLCLSHVLDNCDLNRKLLLDCNGPQTVIAILIRTKNEKARKVTLGILQDCLPIESSKNHADFWNTTDAFSKMLNESQASSPKPDFVASVSRKRNQLPESCVAKEKHVNAGSTVRESLRTNKRSFTSLSQGQFTSNRSKEFDQNSKMAEKSIVEQDVDAASILDILENQGKMIESVCQQLDSMKQMASVCGSCSGSVVISTPVKFRRVADMLSVRSEALYGSRSGGRISKQRSRVIGSGANTNTKTGQPDSCDWYDSTSHIDSSRNHVPVGVANQKCVAQSHGLFKVPSKTLSLSSRFSLMANGTRKSARKLQGSSVDTGMRRSQRGKVRTQPSPVPDKNANDSGKHGTGGVGDNVSQVGSEGGESLRVTISKQNGRCIDRCSPVPRRAERKQNGFEILSRKVLEPSESECSKKRKEKVYVKRSYGEMKLRPRTFRGLSTAQQSCQEKVEGWIEKNLSSAGQCNVDLGSMSRDSSVKGAVERCSVEDEAGIGSEAEVKVEEVASEAEAKGEEPMAMTDALANEDQLGSIDDETFTPCNLLKSAQTDASSKVRRVLNFQKDYTGTHGGEMDGKQTNGASLHCQPEDADDLISEISSHCQQDGATNGQETVSGASNTEVANKKCLGCYPFTRFPFFVLNSRNCAAALRKDEHTCQFHRSIIDNEAKLEPRVPSNDEMKDADEQLSTEVRESLETESVNSNDSSTYQSASKARVVLRQNTEIPSQGHGKQPSVYTTSYGKRRRIRKNYEDYEVVNLHKGVEKFGKRWNAILNSYKFQPGRSANDLKDKYRNLVKPASSSVGSQFSTITKAKPKSPFTAKELVNLKTGYGRYGARWKTILNSFQFQKGRTAQDLQAKFAAVCKRF